MKDIINHFSYPDDGDKSTVNYDNGLVNAFFANDLYKLSMAPVIDKCSKDSSGCVVQFRLDLRTNSTFNETLKSTYVLEEDFRQDLALQLNKFTERIFDEKTLNYVIDTPGPMWKTYWTEGHTSLIVGKTLIETDRNTIIANFDKNDGTPLSDTDFYEETVILNCIPVPKDPKQQSTVAISVTTDRNGMPDVRATGSWQLCSFLETPMMQCVYEVLHREHLKKTGVSYGAWLAEALYRTFSGMCFLSDKKIKVALFSGRRTGGALFNLVQVYLWNQFDTPFNPSTNIEGRNLGSSSFWALHTLTNMGKTMSIAPSGTHAHELSMTLAVLYPELDDSTTGFVGSQILGHLLYKYLCAGTTPTPMLTDTVGTGNFLKTALILNDYKTGKPALCSFASARQDSGKLEDYKEIMTKYVEKADCKKPSPDDPNIMIRAQPGLMASEIDSYEDFEKAITTGYALSGVGGALGDSEKIISDKVFGGKFDATKHFAASMAVKVAYVWAGNDKKGYTLKTGDGEGKITIDTNASETDRSELNQKALNFQTFHKTARDAAARDAAARDAAARDAASDQLVVFESTDKQETLNAILLKLIPEEKKGGRRTRKNVRKNTKKNKKNKNRRSNRRGSKK
jgi:nicotinic acid phosphoribosyltransferase